MHSLLPENKLTAEDLDPSHTKTIGSYVLGNIEMIQVKRWVREPLERLKLPLIYLPDKRLQ